MAQHEWACLGFMSLETAMDMTCGSMSGGGGGGMEGGEGKGGWERGVLGERPDGGANSAQAWSFSLLCIRLCYFAPSAPIWGFQGLTISPSLEIYLFTGVTGLTLLTLFFPCARTWRPPSSGRASRHHSTIRHCRTENGVLGLEGLGSVSHCCSSAG